MANRDGRRSAPWNPLGPQRSEGPEPTTILSEAAPRGAVQEAVLAARTAGKIVGGDGFKRGGPAHRFYANSKGEMVPNSEGDSARIGSSEPRTAPQGLANIGSDPPHCPPQQRQRHTAARVCSRRMRSAVDERKATRKLRRMRRDPAFGPKTLTHEICAAADDSVAVLGTRSVGKTSPASQGAGLRAYSTTKRTAAFAAARSSITSSPSQTAWANSRAVRAAVATEQVPLP
jgi:hypothetical protein